MVRSLSERRGVALEATMTGRISGNRAIAGNSTYNEEVGATVTPTARPHGDRPARVGHAGPARGTVRDEFIGTPPARTPTVGQSAVAARHAEIRSTASALLERAQSIPAGPARAIPSARTETFQGLVDRQHTHAVQHGAIMTGASIAAAAVGAGTHHLAEHVLHAGAGTAMAAGIAAGAGTHVVIGAVAGDHALPLAASTAASALGEVAGEGVIGVAGGTGMSVLVQSMAHIIEDGDARTEFQQRATQTDAARATAIRLAGEHRGAGEVDARFAAAGRGEINWNIFRTNGDYAAGVRQALRNAQQNPADVAYLSLERPVPMRTEL
jgi:hypothetical protein